MCGAPMHGSTAAAPGTAHLIIINVLRGGGSEYQLLCRGPFPCRQGEWGVGPPLDPPLLVQYSLSRKTQTLRGPRWATAQ